jgi:thiamine-monophosphate kinase
MRAHDIGWRALATNLSDIAAMGARPVLTTVALGLPPAWEFEATLELYRGMLALASRTATALAGGDVVAAPVLTLSLTVVGEVRRTHLKRRDGGRSRDVLALTGPLGAARAGLELLRADLAVDDVARLAAQRAFAQPEARLREGRWLGASANVHAMMDISDGLSTDAIRLARASECGLQLENVPVHSAARAIADAAGADPNAYALDGGDDYELLVAIAPRAFTHLARRFAQSFGKALLRCGSLNARPGDYRLTRDGEERALHPGGWDHLAAAGETKG